LIDIKYNIKITKILHFDKKYSFEFIKSIKNIKITKATMCPALSVPYLAKLIKNKFINKKIKKE
jgi:hypothetical protein